jgi:hypothetical protein
LPAKHNVTKLASRYTRSVISRCDFVHQILQS